MSLSSEFQHLLHHGPDPVVDVVECRVAHEGWGRDHLVFLVHVSFVCRVTEKPPRRDPRDFQVWSPGPCPTLTARPLFSGNLERENLLLVQSVLAGPRFPYN